MRKRGMAAGEAILAREVQAALACIKKSKEGNWLENNF